MGTYKVTDPTTGKTVKLTGDSPPTEQELNEIFSSIGGTPQQKQSGFKIPSLATFTGALLPSATNIATDVGKTIASRIQLANDAGLSKNEDDFSNFLYQKFLNEQDPTKKQQRLEIWKGYNQDIAKQQQERIKPEEMSSDIDKSFVERGLSTGGEIGSLFIGGGKLGSATKLQRVGSSALQGATSSAIRGATKIQESEGEQDLIDRAKSTLVDALFGGVVGAGVQGGVEGVGAVRNILGKSQTKIKDKALDYYANTLKENKSAIKKIHKLGGGKGVAEKALLMDDIPKDKASVIRKFEEYKPVFEKQLDDVLSKSSKKQIDVPNSIASVRREIIEALDTPETKLELKQALDYLDDASKTYKSMNPEKANALRRRLDNLVGEKTFSETKGKEKAIKMLAGTLRSEVKDAVPDSRLLFDRYSLLATLSDVMQKDPKFGLTEILGGLAGGSAFGPGGNLVGLGIATGIRKPSNSRRLAEFGFNLGKNPIEQQTPQLAKGIPFLSSFGVTQKDSVNAVMNGE